MKKYISLLVIAIVAILSSCSNEEVTISKTVNFTVNPKTVVEPFISKYSYILSDVLKSNKGELESFSTNYRLRVRLYVYDKNGGLVKTASSDYSNYDVKLKESFMLPVGAYTAIAISDIYSPGENFEHWAVSGSDNLATLKISDTGFFGDARTILGASKQSFTVGDTGLDVNINLKSVGALFLVLYTNIFTFPDRTEYELSVNKEQSSVNFDSNGDYTINAQNNNGSYDWRISSIVLDEIDKTKYSGARRWATQLPMSNVGMRFSYYTNDSNNANQLGSGKTFDIKSEDGYFCWLYLSTSDYSTDYLTAEEAESLFKASGSRMLAPMANYSLMNANKHVKRYDSTVGQFIYPKNL